MTRHQDHFGAFQPHTRLKHAILDTYIPAWAMKLLMWGAAGHRLAIVDAFAGEGRDEGGSEGSPLIAIRRARECIAEAHARNPGKPAPEIHVFAIESNPGRFRALERNLTAGRAETSDLIHVLRGTLSDHLGTVRSVIGNGPTLYFLDPFGIKGLDATTYAPALAGPNNEIFALFANMSAVRLHGVVTAERADPRSKIEEILTSPSLFPDHDAEAITEAERAAAKANNALDATVPASREALSTALGGDTWVAELDGVPPQRRPDVFLSLFQQALVRAGARRVLAVPMRDDEGHRVYALVHASKSPKGFMAMKEAVSTRLRDAEMNGDARDRITADLAIDVAALVDGLRQGFAGATIPWAEKDTGLRDLLFAHTPLFPLQANDVKLALKDAGILQRVGHKEVCVFPTSVAGQE